MITPLSACRICGGIELKRILDLGVQVLTGVFPKQRDQNVTRGPLALVKCTTANGCGLVQLADSYDLGEMYGDNYGYRSGLNASMVAHLTHKVRHIETLCELRTGDLVVDIGSNDGTTLGAYASDLVRVGVDPSGAKFAQYYAPGITLIPDFFSAQLILERYPRQQAKVVTSFSMFYDLERPMNFMQDVFNVLAPGGLWVFEQSYIATMLEKNSYDTVCHEHLEYYAIEQIKWMTDRVGFELIDVELNDVNGGSFSVVARKPDGGSGTLVPKIAAMIEHERELGLHTLTPYAEFASRVEASRTELMRFLSQARSAGKSVAALGASTKGNVLLQFCAVAEQDLACVGEVNPEKLGAFTPGTLLPIVDQADLIGGRFDYLVVLPWHFRAFFDKSLLLAAETLVYPLPKLEIVGPRHL